MNETSTIRKSPRFSGWAVAPFGAIFLGAIGSGVWEGAKPMLAAIQRSFLTLITLGADSYKSGIYAHIAQGFHEHASAELLVSAFGLGAAMAVLFLGVAWVLHAADSADDPRSKSRWTNLTNWIVTPKPGRLGLLLISAYLCVFVGVHIATVVRIEYEQQAISHYFQLTSSVRPYVSEIQSLQFHSRFSQIRSGRDYASLVDELASLAKSHNLLVPEFEPW